MKFWNTLINAPLYQKGDYVTVNPPHSQGNEVLISEVYPNCTYKAYVPYTGYYIFSEKQIIKKLWNIHDEDIK